MQIARSFIALTSQAGFSRAFRFTTRTPDIIHPSAQGEEAIAQKGFALSFSEGHVDGQRWKQRGWRRAKLCVFAVARGYFAPGQLQFITSNVYRRLKVFNSQRLRFLFVELLREYHQEKGFLLIGWVLMPEHIHLLIKPESAASTNALMQEVNRPSTLVACHLQMAQTTVHYHHGR